ncbi:hypothetical protein ACR8AL_12015 [Clavibacter sepedonicus]|uniref:Secreted protein n=1 Tax=Clavibacter sepedonicus TaxID=31964 RepID=B0RCK8_CLASE|nr:MULTISPECIES: hypothetical protein [Clavibacter]MBD5382765.1 hypothetical protein [Clavibacter sp.]OQJ49012.1 hypothetical protein B5P19_12760 [Clavibacter sepedonicus]OQJ53679.1 hypothetical protein B5P20_05690 [Clavibacter sepedonicus]UUK65199.1 hypothetical protein LRE50_13080 [Clavibacter sepedonicus]CAQ00609.1 putative secreted protein [Clavibacter sepedonicus]
MKATAPLATAPLATRDRRTRALDACLCIASSLLVAVGLPAERASAATPTPYSERAPHTGRWNGIDIYVGRNDVHGLILQSYGAGTVDCVRIMPGWVAVPFPAAEKVQDGADATVSALDTCERGSQLPDTTRDVFAGEHWHLATTEFRRTYRP